MARYMSLDPEPSYRAVMLLLYPGIGHGLELKTYVDADGISHIYHSYEVYGPHAKAQATTALNKMKKEHERFSQPGGWYFRSRYGVVPQAEFFIEESQPQWKKFVKP